MQHVANDALLAAPVPAAPPAAGPRIRTWHLFAALVVLSGVLMWVNKEFVMTREVYHNLLGEKLDAARIDENFDMLRQSARWGYLALPLLVWVRVALVAMLLQLFFLLFLVEVPVGKVFRAALWAYPALLYGTAVRLFLLVRTDASAIDQETLSFMPGSLAAFFPGLAEAGTASYSLLSLVSVWELLWCAVLFFALRKGSPRIGKLTAGMAVAGVWTLVAFFQWGIALYITGVR